MADKEPEVSVEDQQVTKNEEGAAGSVEEEEVQQAVAAGMSLLADGHYAAAVTDLSAAVTLAEQAGPLLLASARHALGTARLLTSDVDGATEELKSALTVRAELLGEESEDTLRSAAALLQAEALSGRFFADHEARAFALVDRARANGEAEPLFRALRAAGLSFKSLGKTLTAKKLLEEAYGTSEGLGATERAGGATELGSIVSELGDNAQAAQLLQEAIDLSSGLSESHPVRVRAQGEAASVSYDMDNSGPSEELYNKTMTVFTTVVAAMEKEVGKDNFVVADILIKMAEVHVAHGQVEEAIQSAQESIAMRKRLVGVSGWQYGNGLVGSALVHLVAGVYDKADELLQHVAQCLAVENRDEISIYVSSLAVRASLLMGSDLEEAHALAEEAVRCMRKREVVDESPSKMVAGILSQLYCMSDAIGPLESLHSFFSSRTSPLGKATLITAQALCSALDAEGQLDKAVQLASESLAGGSVAWLTPLSASPPNVDAEVASGVAGLLLILGKAAFEAGDHEKAVTYNKNAAVLLQEAEPSHPSLAQALCYSGLSLMTIGQVDAAQESLGQAAALYSQGPVTTEEPGAFEAYWLLTEFAEAAGKTEEANSFRAAAVRYAERYISSAEEQIGPTTELIVVILGLAERQMSNNVSHGLWEVLEKALRVIYGLRAEGADAVALDEAEVQTRQAMAKVAETGEKAVKQAQGICRCMKRCASFSPLEEAGALVQLGKAQAAAGQGEEAIASFRLATERIESQADEPAVESVRQEAERSLGISLVAAGQWQEAVTCLERVTSGMVENDDDSEASVALAVAYRNAGMLEECRKHAGALLPQLEGRRGEEECRRLLEETQEEAADEVVDEVTTDGTVAPEEDGNEQKADE